MAKRCPFDSKSLQKERWPWLAKRKTQWALVKAYARAIVAAAATAWFPVLAQADSGSGDALQTFISNATGYLSGPVAALVMCGGVIWCGYEFLEGHLKLKPLLVRCLGGGLIFGASYLTHNVLLANVST